MSALIHGALLSIAMIVPLLLTHGWLDASAKDLAAAQPQAIAVATAAVAEEGYCTPALKQIVRRVAGACGLIQQEGRGCQPADAAKEAIGRAWADRRGASFFFVVARASPDGKPDVNQLLSEGRAKAVLTYLKTTFADPDIEKQVGLLWLGEEFAQLPESFCTSQRSRAGLPCDAKTINRSSFIAWIDCAI